MAYVQPKFSFPGMTVNAPAMRMLLQRRLYNKPVVFPTFRSVALSGPLTTQGYKPVSKIYRLPQAIRRRPSVQTYSAKGIYGYPLRSY